jgi:hypothetical protein
MPMSASAWSTQQLAEFLAAVSLAETEAAAAWATVERTAEELDAEVAAIVCGGQLLAAVGCPEGAAPVAELAAVSPGVEGQLAVPGLGVCPATAVRLEHPPGAKLVVARCATGLGPREASLLRGIAHASSITMRMLRLLDDERAAREESAQRQTQLAHLANEQAALRRVATLVAAGASPPETFSAVAAEVGQLLGADVTMVLRYEVDGTGTVIGGWSVPGVTVPQGSGLTIEGVGVAVSVLRTGQPARTAPGLRAVTTSALPDGWASCRDFARSLYRHRRSHHRPRFGSPAYAGSDSARLPAVASVLPRGAGEGVPPTACGPPRAS